MTVIATNVIALTVQKMFTTLPITLTRIPTCTSAVDNLNPQDFEYYDKDGFELNRAERKFYDAMKYPIDYPMLNHKCWQEPWLYLNDPKDILIMDHCMFLCRANYADAAAEQLTELKSTIPQAGYLLQTKQKWGFDFALDAISDDGDIYEVIHIEYDSYSYDEFSLKMYDFELTVHNTDWYKAARAIWSTQETWKPMTGFEQNNWKSRYLLKWDKAEYTEKSV